MALTATQKRGYVRDFITSTQAFDALMSAATEAEKNGSQNGLMGFPHPYGWQKTSDPTSGVQMWLHELVASGLITEGERNTIQGGGNITP